MRFSSAISRCPTRIISPAFSSSFKERLTVISHRKSSAASCLIRKYTNRIPFSSSNFFVSIASSILQYICYEVGRAIFVCAPGSEHEDNHAGMGRVAAPQIPVLHLETVEESTDES